MTDAIFLSYASQDADAARRICDDLRAAGLEVWFDQSELRGGDAWAASIRKQIKECALFVPIVSENTQQRPEGYFRLAWKLAVDRSHLMADTHAFFFPVVLGNVTEPAALVPDKFRERQWSRLNDDSATKAFAAQIAKLTSGSASPNKNTPNTPPILAIAPHAVVTTGKTPSIAVLAFANRSASADDEYFSDGLADELLNVLAKIKGLRVVACTSSFAFKGKSDDIATIGAKLNVATLLEGSVRKSGNRVRISVQLVKVADSAHLWSETYDRTLDDIFAVQDDIARSVVQELRSTLLGSTLSAAQTNAVAAEVARASNDRSDNIEAQRLFLQGRFLLGRMSEGDITRSVDYFEQALALDPGFALAWAWLATAHFNSFGWGSASIHEAYAKAVEAASKALAIDPDSVDAHLTMASLQMHYQRDWASAEASLRRALQLAPDSAAVLVRALILATTLSRHDEAQAFGERAIALDPLNGISYRGLTRALFAAGKLDLAVENMRHSLALAPDATGTHHLMAIYLSIQGHLEDALAEALLEKSESYRLTSLSIVKWAMNTEASRIESDAVLAELIEKHADHSAVQIAEACAFRGETDATFRWLERAYDQREAGTIFINAPLLFGRVKNDPRWPVFLKKVGLVG